MSRCGRRAALRWACAAALAALVAHVPAAGRAGSPAPGSGGGWGPHGAYHRHWNSRAVETVGGVVTRVRRVRPARGMDPGVVLLLQTPRLPLVVHLGPAWFLDHQEIRIGQGDRLQVRGSLVTIDGQLTLIAERVTRGADVLVLRDEDGFPFWSAWRRR